MAKKPRSLPYIPPEIVENILSRFPAKSLGRFLSVSKAWHRTILDPKFRLTAPTCHIAFLYYDSTSTPLDDRNHTRTFDIVEYRANELTSTHWHDNIHAFLNSCGHVRANKKLHKHPVPMLRLLTSYKGLVLLSYCTDIFLLNPLTKQCERVLSYPSSDTPFETVTAAFFYDSSTDDYKVLIGTRPTDRRSFTLNVHVTSLKVRNWEGVNFPYKLHSQSNLNAYVVDEKVHWLVVHDESLNELLPMIVYFDHVNDKFVEVPTPQVGIKYCCSVGVLDECLSAITWSYVGSLQVWVMKEHGVEESWTKLLSITRHEFAYFLHPLLVTGDGEIFMSAGDMMIAGLKPNGESRDLVLPKGSIIENVITYEESLYFPTING